MKSCPFSITCSHLWLVIPDLSPTNSQCLMLKLKVQSTSTSKQNKQYRQKQEWQILINLSKSFAVFNQWFVLQFPNLTHNKNLDLNKVTIRFIAKSIWINSAQLTKFIHTNKNCSSSKLCTFRIQEPLTTA